MISSASTSTSNNNNNDNNNNNNKKLIGSKRSNPSSSINAASTTVRDDNIDDGNCGTSIKRCMCVPFTSSKFSNVSADDALSNYYSSQQRFRYCNNDNNNNSNPHYLVQSSSSSSSSTTTRATSINNPTEQLMVLELNQLSIEERERIYEEVHGVITTRRPITTSTNSTSNNNTFSTTTTTTTSIQQQHEEDKETIKKLNEYYKLFDIEINKIRKRSAYEKALFLSSKYVKNKKFRLMFIRCEQYNIKKAAQRFIYYFQYKLELFGYDKLVKTITLNDLNEHDIYALNAGAIQILPIRDRSNRFIICNFHKYHKFRTTKDQLRIVWYLVMSTAIRYNDFQTLGIVNIIYNVGLISLTSKDIELLKTASFLQISLPMRYASMHYCYNNSLMRPIMTLIQTVVGKACRIRFRTHYGSHLECQYSLLSFGIPKYALPINTTMKFNTSTTATTTTTTTTTTSCSNDNNSHNFNTNNESTTTATNNNKNDSTTTTTTTATTTNDDNDYGSLDNTLFYHTLQEQEQYEKDLQKKEQEQLEQYIIKLAEMEKEEEEEKNSNNNNHAKSFVSLSIETYIEIPKSTDIILGRGRPYQEFPGNIQLAKIINEYRNEYQSSDRRTKTTITNNVLQIIKDQYNGRFLKRRCINGNSTTITLPINNNNNNNNIHNDKDKESHTTTTAAAAAATTNTVLINTGWIEVSDEVAREKISHGFRTKTRRNQE